MSTTHNMFDERPIRLGGFVLTGSGCVLEDPSEPATEEGWQLALDYALSSKDASELWVPDLWNYAKGRPDWREKIDQMNTANGHAHRTMINNASILNRVTPEARKIKPKLRHLEAVAALPPKEQIRILKRVAEEDLNSNQTRALAKQVLRPNVIDRHAALEGQFRVILARPSFDALSPQELCKLPIASFAARDSALFLIVAPGRLLTNPGPRDIIEKWGFTYKTNYVWDKAVAKTYGTYSVIQHAHILLATRGACPPDAVIEQHTHASIVTARVNDDEMLPPEVRRVPQKLYTEGPYLELFGRASVHGWTVFGNDPKLWETAV